MANVFVDEALRSEEHPGIIFRAGPTGRRAGLAGGPDVWEVIDTLQMAQEDEPELAEDAFVEASAQTLGLAQRTVRWRCGTTRHTATRSTRVLRPTVRPPTRCRGSRTTMCGHGEHPGFRHFDATTAARRSPVRAPAALAAYPQWCAPLGQWTGQDSQQELDFHGERTAWRT